MTNFKYELTTALARLQEMVRPRSGGQRDSLVLHEENNPFRPCVSTRLSEVHPVDFTQSGEYSRGDAVGPALPLDLFSPQVLAR